MNRRCPFLLILLFALVSSPACRGQSGRAAPFQWEISSPEQEGVEGSLLEELGREIRQGRAIRDIHSLIIARNGKLIWEEYYAGWDSERLHTLQSVSKSFTSALIGIAVGAGHLRLDERIVDFFPGRTIRNLDARKRAMTVRDLLTMRSGNDYREGFPGSPHSQLNALDRGWTQFILDRPMLRQPGTHFQYDSGGVILLSALLKARIGQHADSYARQVLFEPLGISRFSWYANQEGHPHTGGGLELRPRDMARFGQLFLQEGRWEERQIVPRSWVTESTRRQVSFAEPRNLTTGYGYLWWIMPPAPRGEKQLPVYAAMGFRGQYIFVIPEFEMVVVVTGGARNWQDEKEPREFLYRTILAAVK